MPPFLMGAPFHGASVAAAAALNDLNWRLPRLGDVTGGWSAGTDSDSAVMGGTPGVTYDVTIRFTGVVETHVYSGTGSPFVTGGTSLNFGWNDYKLVVGAQIYWVNGAAALPAEPLPIDYTVTVPILAGETVSIEADSIDGVEGSHLFGGPPDSPGFVGQWLDMHVVAVVPQ